MQSLKNLLLSKASVHSDAGNHQNSFKPMSSASGNSGPQKSFPCREGSLLSTLPSRETWAKRGLVERRTIHANVIWRERQMILTNDNIYFARPDSDVVVDKLAIEDIISVGKVDSFEKKGNELMKKHISDDGPRHGQSSGKNTRGNVPKEVVHRKMSSESLESFQEGTKESFAFEIKALFGNVYRSYFVRVSASYECDSWIKELNSSLRLSMQEQARKGNFLSRTQQIAQDLYDHFIMRCIVAFAIILDFLSSVFESEFKGQNHEALYQALYGVDILLCVFFSLELTLNFLGNWRTIYGAPFVTNVSNWFLLATVIFQLSGFFFPSLDAKQLKVVRIIRIFDVGNAFEAFRSCQMIITAIKHGANPAPVSSILLFPSITPPYGECSQLSNPSRQPW
jgi:hypothetical protein